MKKILSILFICLMMICPLSVKAEGADYFDVVAELDGREQDGEITLYLFRGEGCPHCEDALKWISSLKGIYPELNVVALECWQVEENKQLLFKVKEYFGQTADDGVPFIVVGDSFYLGFNPNDTLGMENSIRNYYGMELLATASYDPSSNQEQNVVTDEVASPTVQETIVAAPATAETVKTEASFLEICGGVTLISFAVLLAACSYRIIFDRKNIACDCGCKKEETEPVKEKKKATKKAK